MRNGSVLMSARIDDPHNTDRHHPDTNRTRLRTSRGFARSDDGAKCPHILRNHYHSCGIQCLLHSKSSGKAIECPSTIAVVLAAPRCLWFCATGGATWAEQWTLWERQPEIPDLGCSDALTYSNKTGAMYFGHPGEWIDPTTGPTPDRGARSNYTILRSLDEGASWHFLDAVFSAGSGYSDMHLLQAGAEEAGDLIGVAFQMSTSWHNGEPIPKQYDGARE
jgi:hypothetical protein